MLGFVIGCAATSLFFYIVGVIGDEQERRHRRNLRGRVVRDIGGVR